MHPRYSKELKRKNKILEFKIHTRDPQATPTRSQEKFY